MPALPLTEDFATWLNIARQCDYALGIREALSYVVKRPNSLSAHKVSKVRMRYYRYKIYRDIEGLSLVKSLNLIFRDLINSLWKRLR